MARKIQYFLLLTAFAGMFIPSTLSAAWPSDPAVNVPLTEAANDQLEPQICSDSFGGAIVTWEDFRATSGSFKIDVYAQRVASYGAVLWAPDGAPVCTLETWARHPVIASDGYGGAIIVWEDWRSGKDIYAQRLDAEGIPQWASNGIPVCADIYNQQFPRIISDGAGARSSPGRTIATRTERFTCSV